MITAALLPLAYRNGAQLYTWLFQTSAATLREVAADPRHLGAEIGVLAILHTWGQTLVRHPHVPCVVPAGGLAPDHERWVHPRYAGFFLPVKVLSRVFRGKFVEVISADVVTIAEPCGRSSTFLVARSARRILDHTRSTMNQ